MLTFTNFLKGGKMNYHNIINEIYNYVCKNEILSTDYYIIYNGQCCYISSNNGFHSYLYGFFDALQAYKHNDSLQLSIIHNENIKKCIFLIEKVA